MKVYFWAGRLLLVIDDSFSLTQLSLAGWQREPLDWQIDPLSLHSGTI